MMLRRSINLFSKQKFQLIKQEQRMTVRISVIGGASDIGSNLALYLKQNYNVTHLKLFDDDDKVKGIALELNQLPGGPDICAYSGGDLVPAITEADMIVMVARGPRLPGKSAQTLLEANAPAVLAVCKAVAAYNPNAFLALSTSPINSMVPFAATVLYKHNAYNQFKLLGITNIDVARSKCLAGSVLKANPRELYIPVIGGSSDATVVPLFSNLSPSCYSLDAHHADMLTRLVRRAGVEIVNLKHGEDASTIAMAWSINEFCLGLMQTLMNQTLVKLHCFAANPQFGTRYFAGPNLIGPRGIVRTASPSNFNLDSNECNLLTQSIPIINNDIKIGEDLYLTIGKIHRPITTKPRLPKTFDETTKSEV